MASTKVTTYETLAIVAEFTDEDTRTITIDNPKASITSAMIQDVQTKAAGVLIGDKEGAAFSRIKTVDRRVGTTTRINFTS